jgi:hypothetical protein
MTQLTRGGRTTVIRLNWGRQGKDLTQQKFVQRQPSVLRRKPDPKQHSHSIEQLHAEYGEYAECCWQ